MSRETKCKNCGYAKKYHDGDENECPAQTIIGTMYFEPIEEPMEVTDK